VVVKYRVPVGLPAGGKKYPSHTRLDSGRVRVPPAGKKSSPYPYPSGQIPNGYRVPVPELPSLALGIEYEKIDVYKDNYIIFYKEHKNEKKYLKCGKPRFVEVVNEDGETVTTKTAHKQLRYMPLTWKDSFM
jgi:hypothetical protein